MSSAMRKRVGMVVPSLNTIAEDDARRYLPEDIGLHVQRLRLRKIAGKVTREALVEASREAIEQAMMLADADLDVIAFNCTGASITGGPEGAAKLGLEIEQATSTAATTTALAVVDALRAVGARRLIHVCPFAPEFSNDEADFLRGAGFEIVASTGLGFTDAKVAAKMTPREIVEIVTPMDHPEADAIFLACANVRAMEVVDELEGVLKKPVISSNQAVIWKMLKILGVNISNANAGELFLN